ncbi:hypothetical protein RDWZM_000559, partial [Blomia tropicalis]
AYEPWIEERMATDRTRNVRVFVCCSAVAQPIGRRFISSHLISFLLYFTIIIFYVRFGLLDLAHQQSNVNKSNRDALAQTHKLATQTIQ